MNGSVPAKVPEATVLKVKRSVWRVRLLRKGFIVYSAHNAHIARANGTLNGMS